ncbi:hypothetical protein DHBDCA_p1173 [Dehalobacter sp. DCA]|nr:hypothetical protein DHBDCA_p1173 [Dehalobacter sp. DCA]
MQIIFFHFPLRLYFIYIKYLRISIKRKFKIFLQINKN